MVAAHEEGHLRGVERGKHFRLVAEVTADGDNMSDLLLVLGLARLKLRRETREYLLVPKRMGSDMPPPLAWQDWLLVNSGSKN